MNNTTETQAGLNERTFTRLARAAKDNMKGVFENWHSYEKVHSLINEFKDVPADGKGMPEKEIVNILSNCNNLTGYKDKYGVERLCKNRANIDDVNAAAQKYSEFAEALPKEAELDKLFYDKLSEIYTNYKSSGDYITRLVKDRMKEISPELISEDVGTRVLIFRQFLKAAEFPKTKCMSRALRDYVYNITETSELSTKEEILRGILKIKDNVFAKMDDIPKDSKEQWEPLVWSNDIANGIFNNQYTTRIKIYWFAIIFDMSYYTGASNEMFDETTDIQTKLFYEYYADNLINNLLNADNYTEVEPTGHGINFKNFIEVVYLYYIHKTELSPCQKLADANKMINLCKTNNKEFIEEQEQKHNQKDTFLYESYLSQIMNLDKDSFKDFIMENYICGQTGVNPIRAASVNTSAVNMYKKLLEQMKKTAYDATDFDDLSYDNIYQTMRSSYYKEKCSKCEHMTDGKSYKQCPKYKIKCSHAYEDYRATKLDPSKDNEDQAKAKKTIIKNNALPLLKAASELIRDIPDSVQDETLIKILKNIDRKFKFIHKKSTIDDVLKSMFMSDNIENYVTRTKIIILYYYIFMIQNAVDEYEFKDSDSQNAVDEYEFKAFDKFYEEFCNEFEILQFEGYDKNENKQYYTYYGINSILLEAEYQQINPKNIFDSIILFFAFKNYDNVKKSKKIKGDEED